MLYRTLQEKRASEAVPLVPLASEVNPTKDVSGLGKGQKKVSFGYERTRNPSPSATTCEASGGKLASLAGTPTPLALLANTPTARFARPHLTRSSLRSPPPCRSDPRLRPQTALNGLGGRIEVTASNDLGGRIEAAASNGLKVGP